MTFDFIPASALNVDALADLFTAAFEGYSIPITITAERFTRILVVDDLALTRSQVILAGGTPVGLSGLAIRGAVGRIAFFGIASPWRRHGLGRRLCARLLDVARDAGLHRLLLEVIDTNTAARLLYEQMGFQARRTLGYWEINGRPASLDPAVTPVPPVEILPLTARWPRVPRAWQQATLSLAHWLPSLEGHVLSEDGHPLAYVLSLSGAAGRQIMDLAVAPEAEADGPALVARMLSGLTGDAERLVIANLPDDDPIASHLPALGFTSTITQWEMSREVDS